MPRWRSGFPLSSPVSGRRDGSSGLADAAPSIARHPGPSLPDPARQLPLPSPGRIERTPRPPHGLFELPSFGAPALQVLARLSHISQQGSEPGLGLRHLRLGGGELFLDLLDGCLERLQPAATSFVPGLTERRLAVGASSGRRRRPCRRDRDAAPAAPALDRLCAAEHVEAGGGELGLKLAPA